MVGEVAKPKFMLMKNNRRHFLYTSTCVVMGLAAGSAALAAGETEAESALRAMDRELAGLLCGYGRIHRFNPSGLQTTRTGSRRRTLPVSRMRVQVRSPESFQASFQKLAELAGPVHVQGNTTRFTRAGRYYVIENRVA